MIVRASFLLALSFLSGLAIGYAVNRRPAASNSSSTYIPFVQGKGTASAAPQELVSTDAKAQRFVAAALRKGNALERDAELYLAIQALDAEDFRRLISDAGALKAIAEKLNSAEGGVSESLAFGLVDRWLAVDSSGLLASVPRLFELIPKKENARRLFLDALAAKRPEEMLALVASRKDPEEREAIVSRALRELASRDLAKAQAWLKTCKDPADRTVAEKAIRLGTVKGDPMRAVELASSLERREGSELMEAAAQEALKMGPGVLRQLATMPMKGWMLSAVLGEFADREPEFAMELALKSLADSDSDSQRYSLQSAFSALARKDPEAALAKLKEVESPGARAAAVSALGAEWAARDPAAALAWLAEQSVSERTNQHRTSYGSNDALLIAFGEWAETNRGDARAWADALPPGGTRDKVLTQFARILAVRGDAAGATQILFGVGSAGEGKAFSDVARSWARDDPKAAADWAISQPAGPLQSRALAAVVGTWGNDNPDGVQEWLAQFPPGEARDRSVSAYLMRPSLYTERTDKQIAEFDAWFDTIEDPWQRAQAARRSYWARREADPRAAREWLSSLPNVDPTVIRIALSYDDN